MKNNSSKKDNQLIALIKDDNISEAIKWIKANKKSKTFKEDINQIDQDQKTPLMLAALYGHYELVDELIKAGSDINAVNKYGKTALFSVLEITSRDYFATENKENKESLSLDGEIESKDRNQTKHKQQIIKIIDLLLKNKANVNITDAENFSVLERAVEIGNLELVKKLVEKGANVKHKDRMDMSPFSRAVSSGNLKLVKYLIDQGVDIENKDQMGMSSLSRAASANYVELAEYLISKGANATEIDELGHSPLTRAAQKGHYEMVESLIGYYANDQLAIHEAIYLARSKDYNEIVELLNNNVTDNSFVTQPAQALNNALRSNHPLAAKILMENRQEELDGFDYRGYLKNAAKDNCAAMIKLLLSKDSSPSSLYNAMEQSISNANLGAFKLLLPIPVPPGWTSSLDHIVTLFSSRFMGIHTVIRPPEKRIIIREMTLLSLARMSQENILDLQHNDYSKTVAFMINNGFTEALNIFLTKSNSKQLEIATEVIINNESRNKDSKSADNPSGEMLKEISTLIQSYRQVVSELTSGKALSQKKLQDNLEKVTIINGKKSYYMMSKLVISELLKSIHNSNSRELLVKIKDLIGPEPEKSNIKESQRYEILFGQKSINSPLLCAIKRAHREENLPSAQKSEHFFNEIIVGLISQMNKINPKETRKALDIIVRSNPEYNKFIPRFLEREAPLMSALLDENYELIKKLLKNGADINAVNERNETALLFFLYFVEKKDFAKADNKEGKQPQSNLGSLDEEEEDRNKERIIDLLLENKANVNITDADNFSALERVAEIGSLELAKKLVAKGANIKHKDRMGMSSLSRATSSGNLKLVKYLIDQGADATEMDEFGHSPLTRAAKKGHYEIVESLIKYYDNNQLAIHEAIHIAISKSYNEIANLLNNKITDNRFVNQPVETLKNALHSNHPLAAKILIENHQEKLKYFDYVSHLGDPSQTTGITELLLDKADSNLTSAIASWGQDRNLQDDALKKIIKSGAEKVKLLLHKKNLNLEYKIKVLAIAISTGNTEIERMVLENLNSKEINGEWDRVSSLELITNLFHQMTRNASIGADASIKFLINKMDGEAIDRIPKKIFIDSNIEIQKVMLTKMPERVIDNMLLACKKKDPIFEVVKNYKKTISNLTSGKVFKEKDLEENLHKVTNIHSEKTYFMMSEPIISELIKSLHESNSRSLLVKTKDLIGPEPTELNIEESERYKILFIKIKERAPNADIFDFNLQKFAQINEDLPLSLAIKRASIKGTEGFFGNIASALAYQMNKIDPEKTQEILNEIGQKSPESLNVLTTIRSYLKETSEHKTKAALDSKASLKPSDFETQSKIAMAASLKEAKKTAYERRLDAKDRHPANQAAVARRARSKKASQPPSNSPSGAEKEKLDKKGNNQNNTK